MRKKRKKERREEERWWGGREGGKIIGCNPSTLLCKKSLQFLSLASEYDFLLKSEAMVLARRVHFQSGGHNSETIFSIR